MLQTILHIPHALGGWPVFGVGWALAIWSGVCILWLLLLSRIPEKRKELIGALPLMLIVGVLIVVVAPRIEERNAAGEPLGVPIRGYGVMMLVAIVAGVGLAAYRAKRMGLDPEVTFGLALWMCIAGVIGARGFYVIQKWDQFQSDDPSTTLIKIFSFTEGGLVVFGSAIGALAALVVFCKQRQLPALAIADLVAPSMMIGLAIGRIGCLLNGCCYGGYCELPIALQFPPEAPAYQQQWQSGELFQWHNGETYGIRLEERGGPKSGSPQVVVVEIDPDSAAAKNGLKPGDVVQMIAGYKIDGMADVEFVFEQLARHIVENRRKGQSTKVQFNALPASTIDEFPARSLPVHPTQIYSAIDALLLALVLWFFYPFRRHDGEVVALMLTLHPISRFLLEVVRIDEPGALGTPFTISQLVGFSFLAAALVLWIFIERGPPRLALPLRPRRSLA
jgi:phosphatidylglycerol:prolipoprotein diacylglycerol transferase